MENKRCPNIFFFSLIMHTFGQNLLIQWSNQSRTPIYMLVMIIYHQKINQ